MRRSKTTSRASQKTVSQRKVRNMKKLAPVATCSRNDGVKKKRCNLRGATSEAVRNYQLILVVELRIIDASLLSFNCCCQEEPVISSGGISWQICIHQDLNLRTIEIFLHGREMHTRDTNMKVKKKQKIWIFARFVNAAKLQSAWSY